MDWATFFKDNSQSLFTLGGVFLGSLITFLISYVNQRFEAKERDKDRAEKRRDAKIQAREKWIERDILKIMDYLDTMLKLYSEEKFLQLQNDIALEAIERFPSTPEEFLALMQRVSQIQVVAPLAPEILNNLEEVYDSEEPKLKAIKELELRTHRNRERIKEVSDESRRIFDTMSRLVYSFEEEDIVLGYMELMLSAIEFQRKLMNVNENLEIGEITYLEKFNSFVPVKENAGNFQRVLRNKLISLRDT